MLEVGRRDGARCRRRREVPLRQSVEPVVSELRPVAVRVGNELLLAVESVSVGDVIGLVGSQIGFLHPGELSGIVVAIFRDPVGALAALRAECAGAGGGRCRKRGEVHPHRRAVVEAAVEERAVGDGIGRGAFGGCFADRIAAAVVAGVGRLQDRQRQVGRIAIGRAGDGAKISQPGPGGAGNEKTSMRRRASLS